jgi:type I restriction enzyme S subunit
MMSNWKTYKLGEITSFISRGVTPSYSDDGVIVINQKCIRDGKVSFEQARFTNPTIKKISNDKYLQSYDVLINSTGQGTLGRVGQVKEITQLTTVDSHVTIVRPSNKVDSTYLGYFLKSKQALIESLAEGSTGQTELARQKVGEIEILAPDLPTQRQIAQILTSLDDKIELNLQMNQTLEAMAQAIFKEWFVNFNFPGFDGELVDGLPKGWRNEPMDENIDFLNGLALQKFPPLNEDEFLPVIKIRELKQGFTTASDKASTEIPEKYVICNGDILFSWSGSLEIVLWCDGKGALNQHLFKVSSNVYPKWFYFFWVREYLPLYKSIAEGKATTMGHIQRRHLTDTIINVPNKELMNLADSILSPILEKIQENKIQIQSLTQIRDTLLPKLMSGVLEVKSEEWKVESEK